MGIYGYPGLPPGYPPPHGMHGAPVPGMPPSAVPTSGFSAPDARRSRSRTAGMFPEMDGVFPFKRLPRVMAQQVGAC